MNRTKIIIMLLAVMLVGASAAYAGASLSGPTALKRHAKAQYTARGLSAGSYALKLRTRLAHGGQTFRCVAFLAAPRRAEGTVTFKGTVPSQLQCASTSAAEAGVWQPATRSGRYELVACTAGSTAYDCSADGMTARRQITLR